MLMLKLELELEKRPKPNKPRVEGDIASSSINI